MPRHGGRARRVLGRSGFGRRTDRQRDAEQEARRRPDGERHGQRIRRQHAPRRGVECPTTTVSPDACDLNTVNFAPADGTGAFSDFPFVVARVLSDGTDCALNGGCYVGTQDAVNGGPTAAALIKFDPSIPLFTLTARVDKTDKVNDKVNDKGVITLKGTVHCHGQGADVDVQVDVRQIVHRAIFESFGETEVLCAADSTAAFRMTIRPGNGLFGPGAASVHILAAAGAHSAFHKVGITLTH